MMCPRICLPVCREREGGREAETGGDCERQTDPDSASLVVVAAVVVCGCRLAFCCFYVSNEKPGRVSSLELGIAGNQFEFGLKPVQQQCR